MAGYLTDAELQVDAARTLAAIGGEEAAAAITAALEGAESDPSPALL
ncbi:MAG: hypothetical protein GWO02_14850, partial [Gammaproteobacteria bacterium]|nr:hypothetical protein [Gammaproteobacteria bacterium]